MHICNAKVNASSPDAAAIAVHKLTHIPCRLWTYTSINLLYVCICVCMCIENTLTETLPFVLGVISLHALRIFVRNSLVHDAFYCHTFGII